MIKDANIMYKACAYVLSQTASGLNRESTAEKFQRRLLTSVRRIFLLSERSAFCKLWKHWQTSLL